MDEFEPTTSYWWTWNIDIRETLRNIYDAAAIAYALHSGVDFVLNDQSNSEYCASPYWLLQFFMLQFFKCEKYLASEVVNHPEPPHDIHNWMYSLMKIEITEAGSDFTDKTFKQK